MPSLIILLMTECRSERISLQCCLFEITNLLTSLCGRHRAQRTDPASIERTQIRWFSLNKYFRFNLVHKSTADNFQNFLTISTTHTRSVLTNAVRLFDSVFAGSEEVPNFRDWLPVTTNDYQWLLVTTRLKWLKSSGSVSLFLSDFQWKWNLLKDGSLIKSNILMNPIRIHWISTVQSNRTAAKELKINQKKFLKLLNQ